MSQGGALALVDRAHPARLGDLVRTLRHTWPDVEVHTDVRSLDEVAPGSVIVLAPRAEDADWLNQRRPLFAERKLKVVLWCDQATTVALARHAVDFFDWISHRQDCPPGPAPFAVNGVRAALEGSWPMVWTGSARQEAVDEVLRAAMPAGTRSRLLVGSCPYDELVDAMHGKDFVVVRISSPRQLRRARWARAQTGRTSRIILVAPGLDCPGFWPVHDRFEDLARARTALTDAGAGAPGRLAALLDLEPEALAIATTLLKKGVNGDEIEGATLQTMDPGVGLVLLAKHRESLRMSDPFFVDAQPPALRGLANRPKTRAAFEHWLNTAPDILPKSRTNALVSIWAAHSVHQLVGDASFPADLIDIPSLRAWALEPLLRARQSALKRNDIPWIWLAAAAASLGEGDVASAWIRGAEAAYKTGIPVEISEGVCNEKEPSTMLNLVQRASKEFDKSKAFAEGVVGCGIVGLGGLAMGSLLHAYYFPKTPWALMIGYPLILLIFFGVPLFSKRIYTIATRESLTWMIEMFVGKQTEREARVRASLAQVDVLDFLENSKEAERVARDMARSASEELGEHHPLYESAVRALASALLIQRRGNEALELIEALLASTDQDDSHDLVILTARILADTGRADQAVRALFWLVNGENPVASSPRASIPLEATTPKNDALITRLLARPARSLHDRPDAHLVLVDALLKQGRYPEALLAARSAVSIFSEREAPAVATLRHRLADLERRVGPPA